MTKQRTPTPEADGGSRPGINDISLADVARMAGVSPATVSRVLNHPSLVRESKRQAVEDVLARVPYIRNNAARALMSRKSLTVGLIVPTLANPFFALGIEAIEQTLQEAGYGLLVACSHRDPDREHAQTKVMLERGVDGMILTGPVHKKEVFQLTHSRGVAVSLQDCNAKILHHNALAMRDADAMALAIDTLVARGHRDIAILTGPTGNTPPVADRLRGARERMTHHFGRSADNDVEETPDYNAESSRLAVKRLFDRKSSYTAIAFTGDILAIGAVMELRRRGLSVPRDISLIGCGDQVMTQYVDPPLTTISLPFREMGERAARRLLDQLGGAPPSGLEYMDFHLIERDSVRTL